jgi:hypothetical protein
MQARDGCERARSERGAAAELCAEATAAILSRYLSTVTSRSDGRRLGEAASGVCRLLRTNALESELLMSGPRRKT